MKNTTLEYYDQNADSFVNTTQGVVFTEIQDLFLSFLPEGGKVLDFGCGSGRDSKYFLEKGFCVSACDGSAEMCKAASVYAGIEVKKMLFTDLCDKQVYDGIWACSSILHCDHESLKIVFAKMYDALKEKGILYTSFKYGTFEGMRNGRYFIDLDEEGIQAYIGNFDVLKEWISGDVRPGRENEKWLNVILRKR